MVFLSLLKKTQTMNVAGKLLLTFKGPLIIVSNEYSFFSHRQNALKEGLALHKQGRIAEAEKCFQQSISISDEMIKVVIRVNAFFFFCLNIT